MKTPTNGGSALLFIIILALLVSVGFLPSAWRAYNAVETQTAYNERTNWSVSFRGEILENATTYRGGKDESLFCVVIKYKGDIFVLREGRVLQKKKGGQGMSATMPDLGSYSLEDQTTPSQLAVGEQHLTGEIRWKEGTSESIAVDHARPKTNE